MPRLIAIACATLFALALASIPRVSGAHPDSIRARTDLATGISLQTSRGILTIEPRQHGIIHVRFGTAGYTGNDNPAVVAKSESVSYQTAESRDAYTLSTKRLLVRINKADATIAFLLPDGTPLLEEAERDAGLGVTASFKTTTALYGLGQHQNGLLDYAGHSIHLQQANTDVAVPMMISPNGWGLLWNNASVTDVDVSVPGAPHPLTIRSEAGRGVDYDFILGPEIDDIIRGYRWLTGDAPLMARWTWGMWQSKERYETQAQLISIPTRYRQMGIPIDAVIQDWQYWPVDQWGSHRFDPARYPDPAAMVRAIHDLHVHTIISVWPRFDLGTANLAALDQHHAVFEDTFNNVYPPGFGRWYDPWNPAGRELYWSQIMSNLGVLGFDGWWLDADEAELGGVPGEMREQATAAGPGLVVANSFPLLHTTAVSEGMRRDQPDKRVFILSRSAYAGQQRNGVITWSGDIRGDWQTLRRQIPAALNFSLSGIPYWSNDIGGFFPKSDMSEADYAELFTRWHQFGVFNPMFRIHGTGRAKEIWTFDAATQNRLKQDVELRYRLLPYLYSTSWAVYEQQKSLMRALAFDFRTDPKALAVTDEYLFGPAFLVAPVLEPNADSRGVYLPGADTWFDFWTGRAWAGGQRIERKVDMSTIPVFVRAGSIVPLGPVRPYADAPSDEPLELRVYPGRDGSFTLYDDAGDGYGYLRGERALVKIDWIDGSRKLRIAARRGAYPGMPATIAIKVVCVGALPQSEIPVIRYDGRAREMTLSSCRVRPVAVGDPVPPPAAAGSGAPFRDPSLPISVRVGDLVSRMTLEEKASQMMHAAAAIPRLGIPAYNWWNEGLHGVAATGYATVFPQAIALAATFDPMLLHTDAGVIATEFRAKYHEEVRAKGSSSWFHGLTVWSPNINIFRDPRWGRGQETYGEDPFLTARMGAAFVTGLQGASSRYLPVVSTPKHFAVHSGPEATRHSADVTVSAHDLEDTYLPAFRATVLAGADSVMCAYNAINGKPACAQPMLLQEHLRDSWDFNGYVVSDCSAASDIYRHHKYTDTMPEGMAAAVKAGMDLICTWPEAAVQEESAALVAAVRQGLLPEADMDRAVRRLFTARMKLGMFDPPASVPYSSTPMSENDTDAHRELSLRTARESLVLLKNKGSILPLGTRFKNIAVIGPNADSVSSLVGNYNGTPSRPVTLLAGIRKRFAQANVTYAQGSSLIGVPLAPVDAQFLQTDSGATGVSAVYFRGAELHEPRALERTDAAVNFSWRDRAAPGLDGEFSVLWTGKLKAPVTGDYQVGFSGTGSFRMWFNGQLVGESAFAGSGKTVSQQVHLEAGATYPIKIESGQKGPGGHAKLLWHRPDAGKDYAEAVRKADLIIAVLGLTSELEGEEMPIKIPGFQGGDRTSLDLPQAQQQLLTELAASGKPVILILTNGSALAVNWADQHVNAILEAWYPGGEGGTAVAELLAGDISPSGKLPVTFYKSAEQLPPFENYQMQGRTYRYFTGEPLYPFGYGLSYSTFAFNNLRFDRTSLDASDDLIVTVDVKNTGQRASDEVVQVYLAHPGAPGAPIRALAGFRRVSLQPGQSQTVSIPIANRDLSVVTPDGTRKIVPGELSVWVGDGQPVVRAGLAKAAGIAGTVSIRSGSILPE